jgi:hypothetical protein
MGASKNKSDAAIFRPLLTMLSILAEKKPNGLKVPYSARGLFRYR